MNTFFMGAFPQTSEQETILSFLVLSNLILTDCNSSSCFISSTLITELDNSTQSPHQTRVAFVVSVLLASIIDSLKKKEQNDIVTISFAVASADNMGSNIGTVVQKLDERSTSSTFFE